MKKPRKKKIWDLYVMLNRTFWTSVIGCIAVTVFAIVLIYLGGFWVGISSIFGLLLGDIVFLRDYIQKKKPLNPIDRAYGIFPSWEHKLDVEFYKEVDKYIRKTAPTHNPLILKIPFYVILIILSILFWRGVATDLPTIVAIGIVCFITSLGFSGGWILMTIDWKAKDPAKISKFFGVPSREWKVDFEPVKRPSSITGLMLVFYSLGVFSLALAPAILVGKVLNVRLILPLEDTVGIVLGSAGAALLGFFFLATSIGLRKMMKGGAMAVFIWCALALFIGVMAFMVVPLGMGRFPLPLYHAIWSLAAPLVAIYVIRRNWRKFR